MVCATGTVGSVVQSAHARFPTKAKKRPWPPRRLIATHPNSRFSLIRSKHKTRQFLTATQNRSVGGGPLWRTAIPAAAISRRLFFLRTSEGRGSVANYFARSAIVSLGASTVPEVYNPGRFLRRHQ